MRAVFSDGNRMVSELHWHPNQENCFLWQTLSISLTLSLSLTLWRTHPALMHMPHPPLLFSYFKTQTPSFTQTHCAKGVILVTVFQKR